MYIYIYFVSKSLLYITIPPQKEKKIETNDKIEPQLYTTPKNFESCGNLIF